jgi:hypothetical protein
MDVNALVEQNAQMTIDRLDDLILSPEEYENDVRVIQQFAGIAASQLSQEPGLEGPDPANPIPLDEDMFTQGHTLFCEGLFDALAKCAQLGITGEIKQEMIQKVAMHVYEQSKQLVAATYGQEHTPEFQFSHDQQVDIIYKATEGYLMALITEHENEYGPIAPEHETGSYEDILGQPMVPLPHAPVPSAGPQTPALRPQGPNAHDKYAAVALLLTTLNPEQQKRILKGFSDEEAELIYYYSHPPHVEQNLDVSYVQAHLKKLQDSLKQSGVRPKTQSYKGILALVHSYPPEKLLSWVKDERPLVKRYIQAHYNRQSGASPDGPEIVQEPLPPRIEDILYRYLAKRLKPA